MRATEAVGVIAGSVGMEVLGPSLQDFVAAALRVGLHLAPAQHVTLYSTLHSTHQQSMPSLALCLFWACAVEVYGLRIT